MDQEQVQKLISELQNGTDRQRRAASFKLRKYKDAAVTQALINAYADSDSSVRQNAIEGLRLIGTKEAQEFLIAQDQSIQVTKSTGASMHSSSKNTVWFLIPLTTIALGLALGYAIYPLLYVGPDSFWFDYEGVGTVLSYGIVGGAIGGFVAGMIRTFSWRLSKTVQTIFVVISIIFISLGFITFGILFAFMIPGAINSLIVFFLTRFTLKQLFKFSENRGKFVSLLVVGTIVSILVTSFFVYLAGYSWILLENL